MTPSHSSTSPAPPQPRWRVLILPGGTEIGLELRQALAWNKDVELFSGGAAVSNHAPYVFARHLVVPSVHEEGWIGALAKVVEENRITHIFPAHDDVTVALAENAGQIPAKIVTSPLETCRLTRSKSATLRLFAGAVPVPRLYASPEDVAEFPVFVKPDRGQGSHNAARADDVGRLRALLAEDTTRIIVEHLPGAEHTVDCFSDRDRGLLYASGRQRRRVRNGIAVDSVLVQDPRFEDYARRIASRLPLHGAWFYQVKADRDGELKLLEVAPRIGGTSGLSRANGVNLPLLSLYEADRLPTTVAAVPGVTGIDRALVSRFRHGFAYRTVYIDLDDTLIVRGQVNPELMKLLYQCLNRGVRIVLLTRHAGDLPTTLRRHRLDGLFDQVVHLKADGSKADHVTDRPAIFIDDSFRERQDVALRTGVPALDPSMAEMLCDDRV